MGDRGRAKAAFSFSWDSIAKDTEAVYYEQLNSHDAPDCDGGLGKQMNYLVTKILTSKISNQLSGRY